MYNQGAFLSFSFFKSVRFRADASKETVSVCITPSIERHSIWETPWKKIFIGISFYPSRTESFSSLFLPRLGRGRRLSIDRGPDLNRFYPQPRLIQSAAMSLLSRPRSRSFCILLFVSALLLVLTPIYAEVSLSFILSVRFIIDCIYFPVQMWIECWLNFGWIRG